MLNRKQCVDIGKFSSEVQALLACGQADGGPGTCNDLERLLSQEVDWDLILDLALLHGMAPLLASRLMPLAALVPTTVDAELKRLHSASLRRNIALSHSLIGIAARLEEGGIIAVPFKGPLMAERLYGDLALRQCADIDVLVRQKDVPAALEILRVIGFIPEYSLPSKLEAEFLAADFELAFTKERLLLDLHWNAVPRSYGIEHGVDGVCDRLRRARFLGSELFELAPEDLFLTLALHGNKHYWERMVWVLDLAQIARGNLSFQWDFLLDQSRRLRAEKLILISIMLIQTLFGVAVPAFVVEKWKGRPDLHRLCSDACRNLLRARSEKDALRGYWFFLRARDSNSDRVSQIRRHMLTVGHGEWGAMPEFLPRCLYLPLHVARLGAKMFRSALTKNGSD